MTFEFFSASEIIAAAATSIVAITLGYRTTRLMHDACEVRFTVVELEFAWDYTAFSNLLATLQDKTGVDRLIRGHHWDSAFAIAYSVALCSILQALAQHVPPAAGSCIYAISWLGLSAGAFDLVENSCLLTRFATVKHEESNPRVERCTDGVLRMAAIMAAIKLVLVGIAINGFLWGVVQGVVDRVHSGISI